MKKIILDEIIDETISLNRIGEHTPIFSVVARMVTGLLVKEHGGVGWTIRTGGDHCHSGYSETREDAMRDALIHNPEIQFYVNIEIKQNE